MSSFRVWNFKELIFEFQGFLSVILRLYLENIFFYDQANLPDFIDLKGPNSI